MRHYNTYIILSAEKSTESTLDNIQRSAELESSLELSQYTFKRAIGRYRGTQETSYIVPVDTRQDIQFLRILAASFQQESILEVSQGHGWLLYTEGSEEYIGSVVNASGREDSYTQVGSKLFTFRKGA
jgi:hypothetical protein